VSARTRIALFAAVLAATFAAALGVGWAVGPVERATSESDEPGHTPAATDGDEAAAGAPDGLAVAAAGLRLVPERVVLEPGTPQALAFQVVDASGAPVREYDRLHERELHAIVASRDLSAFQHVHPELGADGTWRAELAALAPGPHRLFADFSSEGRRLVLGVDLTVPGEVRHRPLAEPQPSATADDYDVAVRVPEPGAGALALLSFAISRNGAPVTPDRYLGALGHLVVLREGDLGYLHTHPEDTASSAPGQVRFETTFPSAGRYRAFLQFSHAGTVHTAAFTIEVEE
jgi:hypothetical protein